MTTIIESISEVIENISCISQTIATAVGQQTTTMNEIAQNSNTGSTKAAQILEHSEKINAFSSDFLKNSTEVGESTQNTSLQITNLTASIGFS